ncbi:hypothetical protein CK203_045624 [Vitis vinifera]|uniref:Uncharacterized protein n=1 Tax=Vitis vinifera TaxID=29760 RepID=A0A438HQ17_VITVI|nr:hypothetical protein CK203_045624 [Vitis vinifera]
MEAVLPVEIEMRSFRVALEQHVSEVEWVQSRYDQLSLLDEKRLRATDHAQAYQRKMTRAFKRGLGLGNSKEVSITSGDIEGHILSFHSVYLPQARYQRQMIQTVGTIEGTFTRCILFHLAMLWASEFELGHNSFLSPLVTFVFDFCLFESFVGNPESHIGAYPFVIKASRALVFASYSLLVRWFLGIALEFDSLFRYSPGPFFGTCPNSHFRYLPEPFSGTCPEPSPVLARTLLRYSPGAFSVLARTLLQYLPGPFLDTCPNPSPVLTRIPPFFRYLPELDP